MPSDESKILDAKPMRFLSDDEALLRARTDFEQAKASKRDDMERCRRYLHIYKALNSPDEAIDESTGMVEDDTELYSDTFLPVGASIADSAIAQYHNLFFSLNEYMEVIADEWEDFYYTKEVTAHIMKRLKEMRFKHTAYAAMQEAVCFDYGVTMTRWLLEDGYVMRPQRHQQTEMIGGVAVQRQRVFAEPTYMPNKVDRSDVVALSYFNTYHDWSAPDCNLDNSRFFIDVRDEMLEKLWMGSQLVSGYGKYQNVEDVIKRELEGDSLMDTIKDPLAKKEYWKRRRTEVVRYWTRDHLVEFSGDTLLRRMNICDWPIQIWGLYPINGQFNPMGLLQRLERNQYDINASLNARRNLQNIISQPFGVMDKSLVGANEDARVYPGWFGVSTTGSPKDKLWVYTPGQNTNLDALTDIDIQIGIMEKQAHITEPAQSSTSGSRTTATEVRQAAAGMATSIEGIALRIEESCHERIYLNLFYLEQANLRRPESFLYNGKEGDTFYVVGPHSYMWRGQPKFTTRGTISIIKDFVNTQQLMQGMDRLMTLQAQGAQISVNWQEMATELMRRLAPRHYEKFIKDPSIVEHNVPPEIENLLLSQGHRVEVSPKNDTPAHIQSHQEYMRTPDYQTWPARMRDNMEDHVARHVQAGAQTQVRGAVPEGIQDSSDLSRGAGLGVPGQSGGLQQ